MLQRLVLLALSGALGTLARYGMSLAVQKAHGSSFPVGTLAVNILGCFLAGLLWSLFEHRWPAMEESRIIVMAGFMGAFTTFSAFIVETGQLADSSRWIHAGLNLLLQNGLGLVALMVGALVASKMV